MILSNHLDQLLIHLKMIFLHQRRAGFAKYLKCDEI